VLAGLRSFVREQGEGEPVVCIHGVPTSSFLYRKVLDQLARRALRGVAFDLPGLGLADRPVDFDYTWTALGRFCREAVDALQLDDFHLVVHDVGGPVGFELAAAARDRIRSLTILNTIVDVEHFERPWVMEPFVVRGVRRAWLGSMTRPSFLGLMYALGVKDRTASPPAELMAYIDLLKRGDGGEAFLKIMRGFERTRAKRRADAGLGEKEADLVYVGVTVWKPYSSELELTPPPTAAAGTRRRHAPAASPTVPIPEAREARRGIRPTSTASLASCIARGVGSRRRC